MPILDDNQIKDFQAVVWRYYDSHGRHDLPWRLADADGEFDPYKILLSELMLQQTQVNRVIPKYQQFLDQFPTVASLAESTLGQVLIAWQGLGYNRRAKYLWQAASRIQSEYAGVLPRTLPELTSLPGIGKNTAGAILAYAFNLPAVFIETNVRTVYIHYFFPQDGTVTDAAIRALLEETIDRQQPRLFYWALMDYGTALKQTVGNMNARSTSYTKQSPFAGSRRQIRGAVLRALSAGGQSRADLADIIMDLRLAEVLNDLVNEGLIVERNDIYRLT